MREHEVNPDTAGWHRLHGRRVRIVYFLPGVHRKPYEIVADYLAFDHDSNTHVLSGRPKFGTAQIDAENVHEMWETDRPIEHPHIYRGETRIL